MRWLRALVVRFLRMFAAEPASPLVMDADLGAAIDDLLNSGVKNRDWFLWECEQLRRVGYAWWLDPYRYEGTEWAYPLPSSSQRSANFNAAYAEAVERFGQERVNRAVAWSDKNFVDKFDPESSYAKSPDPIGMVVAAWQVSQEQGRA